jgi:hypothetical protein
MTPTLITPAADLPATRDEAKAQCRVDGTEQDALIDGLLASAVAHLDGWTGILGRCMMPQTWRVTVADAGVVVLPFPDVSDVSAGYAAGATDLTTTASSLGPVVTVSEPCDVTFTCAMPAHLLPVAKTAVMMMVQRDFDMMHGADGDAFNRTIDALVSAIRWRPV